MFKATRLLPTESEESVFSLGNMESISADSIPVMCSLVGSRLHGFLDLPYELESSLFHRLPAETPPNTTNPVFGDARQHPNQ